MAIEWEPGPVDRFILGTTGAGISVGPSLYNWYNHSGTSQPVSGAMALILCLAAFGSIYLTCRTRERNPLKCILDGIGLPGLFISASIGFQAIQ